MAMGMFDFLKVMVMMMLFWSFAISLYSEVLPEDVKPYVQVYLDSAQDTNSISGTLGSSLSQQTNVPVLDVGALILYSSNFAVNLLGNFIFAVPEMLTLLFTTLIHFAPLPILLNSQITLFIQGLFSALYVLGLIAFISAYRTGSSNAI